MSKPPFYSVCAKCNTKTRHEILCESVGDGGEHYHCHESYAVIQCLGCETKSFRYIFLDYENSYPVSDDDWDVPETIKCYPRHDMAISSIDVFSIPNLVSEIYQESILAINEGARTLAGLGLRGTIEAICNDRSITGRNLEIRISKLATQGLISSKDAERLHAIRFLGNDAAHEIRKPSSEQISVAFKIINHLIQSVYLLELEANGKLDTLVSHYEDFKELLTGHLKHRTAGEEVPLAAIIGKDMRRLGTNIASLEAQLTADINSGTYTKLSLGKNEKYAGSPTALQHFLVGQSDLVTPKRISFSNRTPSFEVKPADPAV